MLLDYSYHTHTARCGHAVGTDREYVEAAIKAGVKELGFTDHVFIPGYEQPGIRGSYELLEEYVSSIRALKEEYKDRINIYVGFEAEYAECLEPYYRRLLEEGVVDYLICGQHMFFDTPTKGHWIFDEYPYEGMAIKYVETIKKAIKSGLFSYIAHPDVFLCDVMVDNPYFNVACREICECAKEYDIPLEINLHGIINRKKYNPSQFRYPCKQFFDIAREVGCKLIIGPDVHDPNEFTNSVIGEAMYIIDDCKDNLISRIAIKK